MKLIARAVIAVIALALVVATIPRGWAASFTFVVIVVALPGDALATPDGVFALRTDGTISRNGVSITGAARQLVAYGPKLYSQGKTNPTWWQWTPTGWVSTRFDDSVLTGLTPMPVPDPVPVPPVTPPIPPPTNPPNPFFPPP